MADQISQQRCFNGEQYIYQHASQYCHGDMRFSAYVPDKAKQTPCPALFWLSGLTCNEENFIFKAGAQRVASELGVILIAPDTSPRGTSHDNPDAYDIGHGAGFYVDATQPPWHPHYQMHSYIAKELPSVASQLFSIDNDRLGIFGHSMGGHGALTLHLHYPDVFRSVSALAPIVAPSQVPWGQKVLTAYLGDNPKHWSTYDACALVAHRPSAAHILIDQGDADNFLTDQLQPELFTKACHINGQSLELRMQAGYDHSYFFIASFIEDHIRHHVDALTNI